MRPIIQKFNEYFFKAKRGGSAPVLLGDKRKQDTAAAAVVIRIQDKRNHVVVGEVRNHEFTIEDRL